MQSCIFCKIVTKEIPAKIIYEDEDVIAFNDIKPKANIHFLVIPKVHIESMLELNDANESHNKLMGNLMVKANSIAKNLGLKGYKSIIHTGVSGGQEVFHLHLHILSNDNVPTK